MKLVVEVSDALYTLVEVDTLDFESLRPADLKGVPHCWCRKQDGAIYLWPKPLPFVKIYRLEPQATVDSP